MFWSRTRPFPQTVTRLAGRAGARILSQDDDTVLLEFPGEYQPYTLGVAEDDGKVGFCTWALTTWRGGAPAVVHALMEHLDGRDRRVTFKVTTADSGKTRCRLSMGGLPVEDLDLGVFELVARELLGKAAIVDEVLRKNGYA